MKVIHAYSRDIDSVILRMPNDFASDNFKALVEKHKFLKDNILRRKEHMLLYDLGNLQAKNYSTTQDFTFIRYKSLRNDR